MKKVLALLLCATLTISMFTGCGKKEDASKGETNTTDDASTGDSEEAPAETDGTGAAKTGLAVITSVASSKDAAEEDGLAEADSTVAAVLVGEDGKIIDCTIDAAQTKVNFSKEGKIATDLASVFKSKQDLGEEYGMKGASGIGKEWNEQADAFAAYAIGKTVEDIKGIAVNEEGIPTDADLASSVTVHIGDFVLAIEKAVNNAKALGAGASDKIGLGVSSAVNSSKDAGAEDGLAQIDTSYAALTQSADGKITSCVIDASQSKISFSKEGKITSDLAAEIKTKQELGAEYGMSSASGIGKEWNEQADAFAAYATGKTVDEVKGVALNEEGVPSDAELTSSVTIHVGDFISTIELAASHIGK